MQRSPLSKLTHRSFQYNARYFHLHLVHLISYYKDNHLKSIRKIVFLSVEQRFCLRLVVACLTFTQGPCYERVFALKKRKNDFQYFDAHNKMSTDWMWCCVSRKATRTLLLLVLLRFLKRKSLHYILVPTILQ